MLGIYDMSGNVAEWTQNTYTPLLKLSIPEHPNTRPDKYYAGFYGGSWNTEESDCRLSPPPSSSSVFDFDFSKYSETHCLNIRDNDRRFRVVRTVTE